MYFKIYHNNSSFSASSYVSLRHPTNPITSADFKRALSDSVVLSIHFLVPILLRKPSAALFQTHPSFTSTLLFLLLLIKNQWNKVITLSNRHKWRETKTRSLDSAMVEQLDVEWRVAPANRTNKNQTRLLKPHWLSQARTRNGAAKSAPNGRNGLC